MKTANPNLNRHGQASRKPRTLPDFENSKDGQTDEDGFQRLSTVVHFMIFEDQWAEQVFFK